MRVLTFRILLVLFLFVNAVGQFRAPEIDKPARIKVTATIVEIGPEPDLINGQWPYQPIKYRIEKVCSGDIDEREIVVSHLWGEYLSKINEGDQVCAILGKTEGPSFDENWEIDLMSKKTHYVNYLGPILNCSCDR